MIARRPCSRGNRLATEEPRQNAFHGEGEVVQDDHPLEAEGEAVASPTDKVWLK